MTPRPQEQHSLSLEQSFLSERGTATAVCSCGAESTVTGKTRAAQWAAAYDWHADHKRVVLP